MPKLEINQSYTIPPVMKEEFRALYSSIEFSGAKNRSICITSTTPNAGKSYIAYHLARVMAEGDKKVLLIDADMRKSTFYKTLGFEKKMIGLSHILSEQSNIKEGIYSTDKPNFYFLPTGVFSSNPTALLRSKLFGDLMRSLLNNVDYIVIDTPPIGLVTDAAIIANICDCSFLVVPSEEESRKSVRESIDIMKKANDNFLGVVLNKLKAQNRTAYGKYSKYGKYGKYGSYVYGEGGSKK